MGIRDRADAAAKQAVERFPQLRDVDMAPLGDIIEHAMVDAVAETVAHCRSALERFDPKSEAAKRLSGELGNQLAALQANLTAMR